MANFDRMPSGLPMQGYHPEFSESGSMVHGMSSTASDDSFLSQVPLPYHLNLGGHNHNNFNPPPNGPPRSTVFPTFTPYGHQQVPHVSMSDAVHTFNEDNGPQYQSMQAQQPMTHSGFTHYGGQQTQSSPCGHFHMQSGPQINYQGDSYPHQISEYHYSGSPYVDHQYLHQTAGQYQSYMESPHMAYVNSAVPNSEYRQTFGMENFGVPHPPSGPTCNNNQHGRVQGQVIHQSRGGSSFSRPNLRGNSGSTNYARTPAGYSSQSPLQPYGSHSGKGGNRAAHGYRNNGIQNFRGRNYFNARGRPGMRPFQAGGFSYSAPPGRTPSRASSSNASDKNAQSFGTPSRPTSPSDEASDDEDEKIDPNQIPSAFTKDGSFISQSTITGQPLDLGAPVSNSEDEDPTPMKHNKGPFPINDTVKSTASHSDSARQILRSRKGQSIASVGTSSGSDSSKDASSKNDVSTGSVTLTIDPVRGPPPAFWPASMQPPHPSKSTSPTNGPRASSSSSSEGKTVVHKRSISSDPFIGNGCRRSNSSPVAAIFDNGPSLHSPQPTYPMKSGLLGMKDKGKGKELFSPAKLVPTTSAPIGSDPIDALVLANQNPNISRRLAVLTAGSTGKPSIEDAFDPSNMPFVEPARVYSTPATSGLVRISNIPYGITRQEIVAFLGRNARIISEIYEPIHIIMERVTSKTMDAYVEFMSLQDAIIAVNRYESNRSDGRGGRLGERHVNLEVVGHERLMADLFPKAKNVTWRSAKPEIEPADPNDVFSSGFQGFLTKEELVMMVKHVEAPQRSPFSKDCPQRPFECLISTIIKYPWYMVDYITLEDRDLLFNAARSLVRFLHYRLCDGDSERPIQIDHRLMRRIQRTIFTCPGFTEAQKDDISFITNVDATPFGVAPYADHWFVFKALGPKRGIEQDVLLYYMALLREATTSSALVTLAERVNSFADNSFPNVFGNIQIEYPIPVEDMTFSMIARVEWDVLEGLLRRVLAT